MSGPGNSTSQIGACTPVRLTRVCLWPYKSQLKKYGYLVLRFQAQSIKSSILVLLVAWAFPASCTVRRTWNCKSILFCSLMVIKSWNTIFLEDKDILKNTSIVLTILKCYEKKRLPIEKNDPSNLRGREVDELTTHVGKASQMIMKSLIREYEIGGIEKIGLIFLFLASQIHCALALEVLAVFLYIPMNYFWPVFRTRLLGSIFFLFPSISPSKIRLVHEKSFDFYVFVCLFIYLHN